MHKLIGIVMHEPSMGKTFCELLLSQKLIGEAEFSRVWQMLNSNHWIIP